MMSPSVLRHGVDLSNGLPTQEQGARSSSTRSTGSVWSMFVGGSFLVTEGRDIPPSSKLTYDLALHNGLELQDLGTCSLAFFRASFKLEQEC